MAFGLLMPRPVMDVKPVPLWQTTFNSALIATSKVGEEFGYRRTPAPTVGSIVDGTIDILSGALINKVMKTVSLTLEVNGSLPNSGWEYLFIADQILLRQGATYSAGSSTQWSWLAGPALGVQSNILLGMA